LKRFSLSAESTRQAEPTPATFMFNYFTTRLRSQEFLPGETMPLRIDYCRRHNARRYILRVNESGDGGCVTIPRGGSWAEARRFAQRNAAWLEERLRRWQQREKALSDDGKILFRGERIDLTQFFVVCPETHKGPKSKVQSPMSGGVGAPSVENTPQAGMPDELRLRAQAVLRELAEDELPERVKELAALHGLTVNRISVRNQRSRWGSCSARGVVSLNWRLVQAPEFVRDYIIIHELMHLRQMNHSARFWELVHTAFPRTPEAERWLKANGSLLRS